MTEPSITAEQLAPDTQALTLDEQIAWLREPWHIRLNYEQPSKFHDIKRRNAILQSLTAYQQSLEGGKPAPVAEAITSELRDVVKRAMSWFDIQSVAHTGELSAKARSIRDDMQRILRATSKGEGT